MRTLEQEFEREIIRSRVDYLLACADAVEIAIRHQTKERAEWMNNCLFPFILDELDGAIEDYSNFIDDMQGD